MFARLAIILVLLLGLVGLERQADAARVVLFFKYPLLPAPSLDGAVNGNNGGAGAFAVSLTTVNTNDLIVACVSQNGSSSVPTVSGGGLTWTTRSSTLPGSPIFSFSAKASSTLSAVSLTTTPNGGTYTESTIFGISGVNFASPFDTNGGLPATSATSPVTVSTSKVSDFIFACDRFGSGTGTPNAGFTAIGTQSFLFAQYKKVQATQSSLAISDTGATVNGMLGDAATAN